MYKKIYNRIRAYVNKRTYTHNSNSCCELIWTNRTKELKHQLEPKEPKKDDQHFHQPKFHEAVNKELILLPQKSNYCNFQKLDFNIDCGATPRPIDYSIKTVICNILDKNGEIVMCNGKPVEVARNFPNVDLYVVLAKESLRFVRYWEW